MKKLFVFGGGPPSLSSVDFDVVDTGSGYDVTVRGSNLTGQTCKVNGSSVTVTATSANSLTFTQPSLSVGAYDIQVGGMSNTIKLYVESTPIVWLEAGRANVVGSSVTGVPNTAKSSVDLSVSQSSTGSRPTYSAAHSSFNSKPAVVHGGSAYLQSTVLGSAVSQTFAIYGVAKWDVISNLYLFDDVDGTSRVAMLDAASGGAADIYAGGSIVTGGTTITAGTVNLFCITYKGSSSALYLGDMTTPVVTGDAGPNGLKSITVGGRYTIEAFLNGAWGTLAAFGGDPDSTTRSRIGGRLKTEYGL